MWKPRRARTRRPRTPLTSAFSVLERDDETRRRFRLQLLGHRLGQVRRDIDACRREEFLPGKRTRVRAGQLAYVDLLVEACELLGLPHRLEELRGIDQQLEVLRVEAELDSAGVELTTSA